jgi:UbiD family decarboxylase
MAFSDLSEFMALLEERGHLKRIKTLVNPELEITEITDRVSKGPLEENVALLFENVEGSDFPVLINSLGHPERMAWALGAQPTAGGFDRSQTAAGVWPGDGPRQRSAERLKGRRHAA